MKIVISTSRNYHKYLSPFFKLFSKYWSSCPYQTVVVSDKLIPDTFGASRFSIQGEWGERLRRSLEIIDSDYILYLQEDYFFTASPCPLEDLIGLYDYLRLVPYPAPIKPPDYLGVSRISLPEMYLNSLQASIWRSEYFHSQLADSDTPWSFEQRNRIKGTHACTVDRKILYLPKTGVTKGRLTEEAVDLFKKEGIELP